MRYTKQLNSPGAGRVEVTADATTVIFSSGRSVPLDVALADILSLKEEGSVRSEGFGVQRQSGSAICIFDLKAGKEESDLMVVSRRGLQRAARLVAQDQARA